MFLHLAATELGGHAVVRRVFEDAHVEEGGGEPAECHLHVGDGGQHHLGVDVRDQVPVQTGLGQLRAAQQQLVTTLRGGQDSVSSS